MILRKQKRVENLLGDDPPAVKRFREEDGSSEESPRKKQRSGDVAAVVEHCAYHLLLPLLTSCPPCQGSHISPRYV